MTELSASPAPPRLGLPAALAAMAAAALLLPWWRADRGAELLGGEPATVIREGPGAAGSVTVLPPDVWTGVELTGPWAAVVAVSAGTAVLLVLLAGLAAGRRRPPPVNGADAAGGASTAPTAASDPSRGPLRADRLARAVRWTAAAAGLAAVAGAVRVLAEWGVTGALGVWVALVAGAAAAGCAVTPPGREWRVSARRVARSGTASSALRYGRGAAAAVVVIAAAAVGPTGPRPAGGVAVGPFVPIAMIGTFPLRSGASGLAATGVVRPVLADGAPGIASGAGVVVATADGRARVLARLDRGAPAPIGVVGGRVVRWISADAVAVTPLPGGSPVDVVVRGVADAGPPGSDGSVWLRTDADPVGTVRRLDVARLDGEQRIAATYLPVVTIQEPEPPVDVRTVLPVRGGAVRTLGMPGRLELLTGTAAGIATTPLAGSRCGGAGVADLGRAAADLAGVWFVLTNADGERLARLDPGSAGTVRTIATVVPGTVTALTAPGDGSLLFVARGPDGSVLWRVPDAGGALDTTGRPPVSCPPVP